MNKFHKLAAITALSLTAAFTYTCSSGGGGNDDPPPSSSSAVGTSSGGGSSSGGSSSSVVAEVPKCGGEEYDTSAKGCCNAALFALATQRCENNVIETKCGSAWYNAADASLRCESNIVEAKCGTVWYNIAEQMCDTRDNQIYPFAKIGTQAWLAKNLNYETEAGSACYGDDPENCTTYGRLYNWATAMDGAESSEATPSGVQGVCPSGWHIPSDMEWQILMNFVDGTSLTSPATSTTAGKKLKATSGWNEDGNGTDDFEFAALPGGFGDSGGNFGMVGYYGYWWSASEGSANLAYDRVMDYYDYESARWDTNGKTNLISVRCVKD